MIWLALHSLFILATAVPVAIGAGGAGVLGVILAAEAALAFVWLAARAGHTARRAANLLTAIRLAAAIGLLATLARAGLTPQAALVWFVVGVVAEATDFLDGLVARAAGPTSFGGVLDMETDALFMLALSLFAVRFYGLPAWVAVAGLLRYAVAIPFMFLPEPRFPKAFSRFAKTACALAALLLVASIAPLDLPYTLRLIVAGAAVVLLLASFGIEALLRVRALRRDTAKRARGELAGLVRSILTYYGVPLRHFRMRRFYRQFVGADDLVFDIGAHVGNRVDALRSLGTRVVAVEPQPGCVGILRRLYGEDPAVTVIAGACGATEAETVMHISTAHPTLSTLSPDWSRSINEHYGELQIDWDRDVTVTTTTLDALIDRYGEPALVKIDVEGFEPEVLAGLSRPIGVISFEFLPAAIDGALETLTRVDALGTYEFNYSMVETMRFASQTWLSADELRAILTALPPAGRSGDVYAKRVGL